MSFAIVKYFHKSLSKKSDLYQQAKKENLWTVFANFVSSLDMGSDELLKTAFKFPRFSKSDIAKLTAKLEMEAKANRLRRAGRKTRSSEVSTLGSIKNATI